MEEDFLHPEVHPLVDRVVEVEVEGVDPRVTKTALKELVEWEIDDVTKTAQKR